MIKALIVDDNYYNRDLSAMALKHIGVEYDEAEDGVEALAKLANATFDILVLDLAMPNMDGVSLLRELRNRPEHRAMHIVVMTANAHMATDEVEAMADHIFQKPIDIMNFAALAKRFLGQKI